MSVEMDKAIESLELELQNIISRSNEIKKTINQLLLLTGKSPKYSDSELINNGGSTDIQKRQFVAKDLLESVKEIMRPHGKKPLTAQEVLDALEKGDFNFPAEWKKKLRLKNLAIYLGTRKEDFVWFKTKDGKLYGLAEQHPERKKELDKTGEIVDVPPERILEYAEQKLKRST